MKVEGCDDYWFLTVHGVEVGEMWVMRLLVLESTFLVIT